MEIQINKIDSIKNLGIVQFKSAVTQDIKFISSAQAINSNLLKIVEVDNSGSVNDLLAINNSNNFVFLMDGDVLVGAKQNRVVNTSVLLKPNSKTVIPVSCVEQGRWNDVSSKFGISDDIAIPKIRKEKIEQVKNNIKRNKSFQADQGKIWDSVSESSEVFAQPSFTSDYDEIIKKTRAQHSKEFNQIEMDKNSSGMVIFKNTRIAQIELFGLVKVYQDYFEKIVNAAILGNIGNTKLVNGNVIEAELKYKTLDFFDHFEKLEFNEHPSIGVGTDFRLESDDYSGSMLKYKNNLIHLSIIN